MKTDFHKQLGNISEEIIKLNFSKKDTIKKCMEKFFKIMRKFGIRFGTPIYEGKKIIGTQETNFEWTILLNLFLDQLKDYFYINFNLNQDLPKDLLYYDKDEE